MANGNGYDDGRPVDYIRAERGSAAAQVIQTNSLSTPVFVVLVLALFIAALVSSAAIMLAVSAKDAAVIAEREARLAQRRYDDMRIYLEVNGIDLPEE